MRPHAELALAWEGEMELTKLSWKEMNNVGLLESRLESEYILK